MVTKPVRARVGALVPRLDRSRAYAAPLRIWEKIRDLPPRTSKAAATRLHRLLGRGTDKLIIPVHALPKRAPQAQSPIPGVLGPQARPPQAGRVRGPRGPKPVAEGTKTAPAATLCHAPTPFSKGPLEPPPSSMTNCWWSARSTSVDEDVLVEEHGTLRRV